MTLRLLLPLTLALLLLGCGGEKKADSSMDDATAKSTHVDWRDMGADFFSSGMTLKDNRIVGTIKYSGAAPTDTVQFQLVMTNQTHHLMGPFGFSQPPYQPGEERPLNMPLPNKSAHFDPEQIDPGTIRVNLVTPSDQGDMIDSQRSPHSPH